MAYSARESLLMKKRGTTTSVYAEGNDDGDLHVTTGSTVVATNDVQSGKLIAEGSVIFPAGAAADTVKIATIAQPSLSPMPKRFVLYVTSTTSTVYNVSIRNLGYIMGVPTSAQIGLVQPPGALVITPSGTAWSSCFTSIGGVLNDESMDWSDAGVGDVPFGFGAANDAIYFGNSSPFRSIQYTSATYGSWVGDGVWEYWNGTAWATLITSSRYPSTMTKPFTNVTELWTFFPGDDWVPYDIAGDPTSQYWIRYRITSYTSKSMTPGLNTGIYLPLKTTFVYGYSLMDLFNGTHGVQLVFNNSSQSNVNDYTPILWQIRSA